VVYRMPIWKFLRIPPFPFPKGFDQSLLGVIILEKGMREISEPSLRFKPFLGRNNNPTEFNHWALFEKYVIRPAAVKRI
jgi:hypothetical protein